MFGLSAYLLPVLIWVLGWKWIRSAPVHNPLIRIAGSLALWFSLSAGCGLLPASMALPGGVRPSGVAGMALADFLLSRFNFTGSAIVVTAAAIVALYFVTTFEVAALVHILEGPLARWRKLWSRWSTWREQRRQRAIERARTKAAERTQRRTSRIITTQPETVPAVPKASKQVPDKETTSAATHDDIPIRPLVPEPVVRVQPPVQEPDADSPPWEEQIEPSPQTVARRKRLYALPSTSLLNEIPPGNGFDGLELKEVASRIKSKLEEFNVRGSVTQINPGPVVTTFEYKPEAGIKYSRITTLTEDLCLGLQAESVLIERLPGKPTVGIEVPNTRREVISLRAILESGEFQDAPSKMTMALGKDINGRIKVASLETMPHLLIAGSTGSGKSVMLNAMIMSFLYKATPDEVRMIMVDPKRVELGMYEGIPHLLTPVITEPKKATNALRNAVLEMERRLKLLAAHGVRNIDQFNRKIEQLREKPMSLFEAPEENEDLRPLPYILILIDELADLMMLERANVEECITRLAQMARAVGMHLVLATQRPSVDVITGLIKANFPSRISFRVATRVDSRTVLDSMGAEHLLGKGDMLYLPPGSSRLVRVHGAFVTETETNRVVDFWKDQAAPDYDRSYLLTPPSEEGGDEEEDGETFDGEQDPKYEDAVRVVLEAGKASTSILQRRLRLGYGRAARILDMMQRDGIIGAPDGSKPREVLKRPDWLRETEDQLR
jgi:S-DNA-T family DNA segregation ATPase FtsK/SpoIIIE